MNREDFKDDEDPKEDQTICPVCEGTGIDGYYDDFFECGYCNGKGVV